MLSPLLSKNHMLSVTPPPRFPQKLWKIANECKSGAVCWSADGKSILLRYSLFKEEFMSSKNDFFKTDNIASFIRQLNLYGFRKVYDNTHKQTYKIHSDLHEFSNVYFKRNKPELLDYVARKSVLKDKNELLQESSKNVDFTDEISSDTVENLNSAKSKILFWQKADEGNPPSKKKSDGRIVVRLSQHVDVKGKKTEQTFVENKENIPPTDIPIPNVPEQVSVVPVKKKRGRKPGSKSKQKQTSDLVVSGSKIYYSPTLKNPEKYPALLYYNDDEDGGVFLRHTSKDVMLSSTLPFQESLEYHELRAAYLRQCETKMDIFKDYKTMFKIP